MSSQLKKTQKPNRLWHLVVKNLKSMIRDKANLVWLLGYPILFIVLFPMGELFPVESIFIPGVGIVEIILSGQGGYREKGFGF